MAEPVAASEQLLETPFASRHRALGARMVPFAGYSMPVQYAKGILAEHQWTRAHAGLFDVSHMGQGSLIGPDHLTTARALETLVPADIVNLKPGQQRYTQLLNAEGGIIDDLMVAWVSGGMDEGRLFLVVNASRKDVDWAHIAANMPAGVRVERHDDRALLALQGPSAESVMTRLGADVAGMAFMTVKAVQVAGIEVQVSRSGYTGEDGYEISVAGADAGALWDALTADEEVMPIGLGARDSLRLEAGLCLYGHDIDETTSPIEAALTWSIQKRRREEGGFPGAARIQREIAQGASRVRVGIQPEGRAPAREGTEIVHDGKVVGIVTSGGFGPSVNGPVAMGYVPKALSAPGTEIGLLVRGEARPAKVAATPFVPHRYRR